MLKPNWPPAGNLSERPQHSRLDSAGGDYCHYLTLPVTLTNAPYCGWDHYTMHVLVSGINAALCRRCFQRAQAPSGRFRPVACAAMVATAPETSSDFNGLSDMLRSPALPAISTLDSSFTLNLTVTGTVLTWAANAPVFKIDWLGSLQLQSLCRRTLLAALVRRRRSRRTPTSRRGVACSVRAWAALHH